MGQAAEERGKSQTGRRKGYGAKFVFEKLRGEILALELKPGQLIDEASLASRFKVSRSPIREALVRLETEGLIDTLPNKGTVVAPLNIEEFPRYIDALDLIQRAVTRLAAAHRDGHDLEMIKQAQAEFRKRVSANDALGMIEQNARFHLAIGAASKNRILIDTYRRILDEGRRALRLYFRSYQDTLPPELCDAHDQIIAAIERQDVEEAEHLAHKHAEEVHQRFIQYISQRSTRDIAVIA